jgi:hypothetical protein
MHATRTLEIDAEPAVDELRNAALAQPLDFQLGDSARPVRPHGLRGRLYVWVHQVSAVLVGGFAAAVPWIPSEMAGREVTPAFRAASMVMLVGLAVSQWLLAAGVKRFRRWAWYVAMVLFALTTVDDVRDVQRGFGGFAGNAVWLCIRIFWVAYFWRRRKDFDV